MAYKITTKAVPIFKQTFSLYGKSLSLTVYFNSVITGWQFDLFDNGENEFICKGAGLSVNCPALIAEPVDFIIVMTDKSGYGFNGIKLGDIDSRLEIHVLKKEEWFEIIRTSV